jgi:hypothetical protein
MLNTLIAKTEQARIIGQIQSVYTNAPDLLKSTMNQLEFEKAIQEDKTPIFFNDVVKGYASDALNRINKETDEVKRGEILKSSFNQLACLSPITVVFDRMTKSVYVDAIDLESGLYKDIAINRKLDRVGKSAK